MVIAQEETMVVTITPPNLAITVIAQEGIITDQRHAPIMVMHITMLHTIIMQCAHIAHHLVHTIAQRHHLHSAHIMDAQYLKEYLA